MYNEVIGMKKIVKTLIPNKIWLFLKFLKYFYNTPKYWVKNNIKESNEKYIRIIFLVQFPETWNSFKTVYEELKQRESVEVSILCIPKPISNNGEIEYHPTDINESFEYFKNLGIDCVNALKIDNQWIDIELLKPDYVIYTRPYNIQYPVEYRSSSVCRFAKTCYIPYAYNMMDDQFFVTFNTEFITNIYTIFVASESRLIMCKEEFYFQDKFGTNKFVYMGFPRFDLITNNIEEKEKNKRFTIAWMPRWTVADGEATKLSGFLKYSRQILDFVKKHKNIYLIIRPHPLMFANFIEKGVMTQNEVERFKKECTECENVVIDREKDYIPLFNRADLLIADYTSLLMEFFVTGKPIIYCDDEKGLNKEAQEMDTVLYHAESYKEIEGLVLDIMEGNDSMQEKRKLIINKLVPKNAGMIGEQIAEYLINDSKKYK